MAKKYNWKELSKELDKRINSCFEMPFDEQIILDRVKNRLNCN